MIDNEDDQTPLTLGIRGLLRIADALRAKRFEAGALSLASPEVWFTMNEETKNPESLALYEHVKINYVVEEFMLLANVSVAKKIVSHYPAYSVLRRHP